jgi:hypothetical protein
MTTKPLDGLLEPISDGTLPRPIPSPDSGHPCVKLIHPGWTPSEDHAGGAARLSQPQVIG